MIILMGLAGSGKSTQGQMLAQETGRVWLSAGQVLRDAPDEKVHEVQQRGELVSDAVVIPLMQQAISSVLVAGKDIVLDGFPRTLEQADWLIKNMITELGAVVRIVVPKDELVHRMALRGRADDQNIEVIKERFRIAEQNIYSICAVFQENDIKVIDVDGVGTVEEVHERLKQVITEVENE